MVSTCIACKLTGLLSKNVSSYLQVGHEQMGNIPKRMFFVMNERTFYKFVITNATESKNFIIIFLNHKIKYTQILVLYRI